VKTETSKAAAQATPIEAKAAPAAVAVNGASLAPIQATVAATSAPTATATTAAATPVASSPTATPTAARSRVIVKFDYDSQHEVELTIKEGQILDVIAENSNGWWKGSLNGVTGLFPFNFCEVLAADDPRATTASTTPVKASAAQAVSAPTAPAAPAAATPSSPTSGAVYDNSPPPPDAPTASRRAAGRAAVLVPGGMEELTGRLAVKRKDYSQRAPPLALERKSTHAANAPPSPLLTEASSSCEIVRVCGDIGLISVLVRVHVDVRRLVIHCCQLRWRVRRSMYEIA
jgi:hypothetical protein